MKCQHYRDVMFDYCEGGLSSVERNEIKLHLMSCDNCRRQFELTELEDQFLEDTSDIPEISDVFNFNVMNMIQTGADGSQIITMQKSPRIRWQQAFPKVGVAAVLLLACLYVPGILPDLQNKEAPEQAALVDNSFTPPSKDVHFGSTTANDESARQSTNQNKGTGVYVQDENLKRFADDTKTSPEQPLPKETQSEVTRLQSQPADGSDIGKETAGSLPAVQDEASRSLKTNFRFAGINDKPSLFNIPGGYILKETNDISESQIAYSYEDPAIQKSFTVNITSSDPVVKMTAIDEQPVMKSKETEKLELDNIAALQNESKKVIEYNGTAYQITVTGIMSQEELDQIAGDISLDPLSIEP